MKSKVITLLVPVVFFMNYLECDGQISPVSVPLYDGVLDARLIERNSKIARSQSIDHTCYEYSKPYKEAEFRGQEYAEMQIKVLGSRSKSLSNQAIESRARRSQQIFFKNLKKIPEDGWIPVFNVRVEQWPLYELDEIGRKHMLEALKESWLNGFLGAWSQYDKEMQVTQQIIHDPWFKGAPYLVRIGSDVEPISPEIIDQFRNGNN